MNRLLIGMVSVLSSATNLFNCRTRCQKGFLARDNEYSASALIFCDIHECTWFWFSLFCIQCMDFGALWSFIFRFHAYAHIMNHKLGCQSHLAHLKRGLVQQYSFLPTIWSIQSMCMDSLLIDRHWIQKLPFSPAQPNSPRVLAFADAFQRGAIVLSLYRTIRRDPNHLHFAICVLRRTQWSSLNRTRFAWLWLLNFCG